ncbi:MAG: DUF5610 domain-containing protein [Saccharospirillum sp.]|nr:DUF5610 domain-containing protein [Saccharospirillum sp.]
MNIQQPGVSSILPPQAKPFALNNPSRGAEKASVAGTTETTKAPDSASKFDVDALVNNLWGFMKGRIAEAQANGASEKELDKLWQAAEKGLKQGFGEAKDILKSMGKLSEPLGNKIDQAYGRLTDALEARDLNAMAESRDAKETVAGRKIDLYQYQERTFSLDLKTREGDTVTIKVMNSQEASASQRSGEGWSSLQWGRTDMAGFNVLIEGDLNEQERADIEALLGQVNELANDFYSGNYDVAWEKAQALNIEGTSLLSMDLNLRSVEAKGVGVYEQVSGDKALPKGLSPLAQYAKDLVEAQKDWQQRFDSSTGLLKALENHPLNKGQLGNMARALLN